MAAPVGVAVFAEPGYPRLLLEGWKGTGSEVGFWWGRDHTDLSSVREAFREKGNRGWGQER